MAAAIGPAFTAPSQVAHRRARNPLFSAAYSPASLRISFFKVVLPSTRCRLAISAQTPTADSLISVHAELWIGDVLTRISSNFLKLIEKFNSYLIKLISMMQPSDQFWHSMAACGCADPASSG
jgi:hypothetical protein